MFSSSSQSQLTCVVSRLLLAIKTLSIQSNQHFLGSDVAFSSCCEFSALTTDYFAVMSTSRSKESVMSTRKSFGAPQKASSCRMFPP